MTTTYGIVSDFHELDYRSLPDVFQVLVNEGAEKFILNGDLVGDRCSGISTKDYFAVLLQNAGKYGRETYVLLGSHEEVTDCEPVLRALNQRYPNLINTCNVSKMEEKDHTLIFLPGSDWHALPKDSSAYILQKSDLVSGYYANQAGNPVYLKNIEDLASEISDADRTIVISHVPARFTGSNAVDVAYFAQSKDGGIMPGVALESMIRKQVGDVPTEIIHRIATQNGFTFKRVNSGNVDLAEVSAKLKIKKAINGHFHESVHNIHDSKGKPVEEGLFIEELFWNASYADGGKFGLLTVDGIKVAYENISI